MINQKEQMDKFYDELNILRNRYERSKTIEKNYYEPGMMEYLDKSYGEYDDATGKFMLRFEVKGVRYDGRTELIEKVSINDEVDIIRDDTNKYNTNNFAVISKKNKNLGNVPAELCNAIAPLYDDGILSLDKSFVSYVEPISKRSRHAKQSMLFVELQGKIKENKGFESNMIAKKPEKGSNFSMNIVSDCSFDSFVAYDLETTGFSNTYDCIVDIGAIKVINGEIVERAEFIFDELVKPYKKSISPQITELTGITKDDVKNARPMWEVIPDFMEFVGDLPLVGYNNNSFDNHFLVRAARHSNIVITNPVFDCLSLGKKYKTETGMSSASLGKITEALGITITRAHRAYPDAVATAKVFMELKEKY